MIRKHAEIIEPAMLAHSGVWFCVGLRHGAANDEKPGIGCGWII